MTFWVSLAYRRGLRYRHVSILVLLEWPSESCPMGDRAARKSRFQSLFYWNDLLSAFLGDHFSEANAFQSLFYWNDLLSCVTPRQSVIATLRFNPCSIGMTFWVQRALYPPGNQSGFQSLFYWNDLLSSGFYVRCARRDLVSILVLLEWPSESYCSWHLGHIFRVSILVLLEWPSEYLSRARVFHTAIMFQSLFYWNDLLSSTEPTLKADKQVSILVLLEWPSESPYIYPPVPLFISWFQSLFYWNDLLSERAEQSEAGRAYEFQSLFDIGMTFWVWSPKHTPPAPQKFQSLFYWNDLLSKPISRLQRRRTPGVSILVLLEWPSELHGGKQIGKSVGRFNPCSIGMTFWVKPTKLILFKFWVSILVLLEWPSEYQGAQQIPHTQHDVSILVLLEWPSESKPRRYCDDTATCFNPCSIGMTFWVPLHYRPVRVVFLFQSLFYWNDLLSFAMSPAFCDFSQCFNPCSIGMTFWVIIHIATDTEEHNGFNPCSIGMTFWVLWRRETPPKSRPVSILVLLEWPSE